MAKNKVRQGICPNEEGCTKASNYEIQIVPEDQPFKCEECGHELEPIDKKRKSGGIDPKLIIIGAVILIGIIVALLFIFGGKSDDTIEPIVNEVPVDSVSETPTVVPNRHDTLVIKVENVTQEMDTVEVAKPIEESLEEPVAAPEEKVQTQPSAAKASSSNNLGYGTWTGSMKNGQPHGMGTLTYSTSHTIDSRDTKGRVAQPGEYIVGEWDNGHLVQGRWFKNDGTKEAVIVGKVG